MEQMFQICFSLDLGGGKGDRAAPCYQTGSVPGDGGQFFDGTLETLTWELRVLTGFG